MNAVRRLSFFCAAIIAVLTILRRQQLPTKNSATHGLVPLKKTARQCLEDFPELSNRHRSKSAILLAPPDGVYFVVTAPSYSETCGGCVSLHRLCDRLNVIYAHMRETPLCYVVPMLPESDPLPKMNPGYKTPMLPPWMDASAGIAVYPEVLEGNPLNATRVIRWILYSPGINKAGTNSGPLASQFNPHDLIACFSAGFCADFDPSTFYKLPLRILDYEFGHYINLPASEQGGSSLLTFRAKKTFKSSRLGEVQVAPAFPVPENPLRDGGKRSRLEQYVRTKRFYTTDPATLRCMEAAMAGTVSVVVPVPGVSKQEWLASAGDEYKYGVAYGEDDLPYALASLPCALPFMIRKAAEERGVLGTFVRQALAFFDEAEAGKRGAGHG